MCVCVYVCACVFISMCSGSSWRICISAQKHKTSFSLPRAEKKKKHHDCDRQISWSHSVCAGVCVCVCECEWVSECLWDFGMEESPTHSKTSYMMFITLSKTTTVNFAAGRRVVLGKQTACVCVCVCARACVGGSVWLVCQSLAFRMSW